MVKALSLWGIFYREAINNQTMREMMNYNLGILDLGPNFGYELSSQNLSCS